MIFLDVTLPDLAANLALDEALLLDAETGGPEVLRCWEWPAAAVVIGAGGQWAVEADAVACARDGVPIARRSSGGGAVLLGTGCLVYSLVLNYQRHPALADLHASYRFILRSMTSALAPLAPGVAHAGVSDLVIAGKKVSGNAQQRKRAHVLHHGTLLCAFDVTRLPRYLPHPAREPDYRRGRSHLDFVTNLGVPGAAVKDRLRIGWNARAEPIRLPEEAVATLAREKYATDAWNRRR